MLKNVNETLLLVEEYIDGMDYTVMEWKTLGILEIIPRKFL